MNRTKIFLITALMGLSLTGITLMQVHWMRKTIRLNEENFDRTVNEALNTVVVKLEKEKDIKFSAPYNFPFWSGGTETFSFTDSIQIAKNPREKHKYLRTQVSAQGGSFAYHNTYNFKIKHEDSNKDSLYFKNELDPIDDEFYFDSLHPIFDSIQNLEVYNVIKEPTQVKVVWTNVSPENSNIKVVRNDSTTKIIVITDDKIDTINYPSLVNNLAPPPPPPIPCSPKNTNKQNWVAQNNRMVWTNQNLHRYEKEVEKKFKHKQEVIELSAKRLEEKEKKQQQAIMQLVYEMNARKTSLKERIDTAELHNLIALELKNKGVQSPFEFALVTKDTTKKEVFATTMFNQIPNKSTYSVRLFPNNFVPLNDFLEVKFMGKGSAIYKSVILPIAASLFFTLIVLLTFSITLVTIIKQKKLAEMKADFINNMTHELKTPIATISLASDSIENPKVVDKPETVKYFTAIIREENSRMNRLVESVLQTARLERKTLKLNLKEVNVLLLVEKVTGQMRIQAEAKGGSIYFAKPEVDLTMTADANLMENVIFNLIDNAIKYTTTAPNIVVTLKNLPGGISLSVQDNGIGMSRSEQQHVFDKFYRVSQGDVHNIKGFGLGLSNVKEITELHGGIVQLRSELGKGSTFTLFFPNKQNGNDQRG